VGTRRFNGFDSVARVRGFSGTYTSDGIQYQVAFGLVVKLTVVLRHLTTSREFDSCTVLIRLLSHA
jgi:hypothetical protein